MIVYWFFFALPVVGILLPYSASPALSRTIWLLAGLTLTIVIGLRDEVGPDWGNYMMTYEQAVSLPFAEVVLTADPGYAVLNWLSGQVGGEIYLVNTIAAGVLIAGVIAFARQQPLPWLALLVSTPYLINVVAMSLTRQSIAIGLELIALVALTNGRTYRYAALIAFACLFHKSAVLLLPFAALVTSGRRVWTVVWVGVTFVAVLIALVAESYDYFVEQYVRTSLASDGGGIRLAMNSVAAAIFIAFRRHFTSLPQEKRLWTLMSVMTVACIPLLAVSSTAADRLALYLLPVQMFVFSRLPLLAGTQIYRAPLALGIVFGYGLFQLVWSTFGNFVSSFSYKFMPIL
jgi:hypothetical protein